MYCKNCGQEINENAAICVHCGVATDNLVLKQKYTPIIGFILSFFVSLAGLIVSIVEYRKAKREGGVTSFALAGIIISSITLGLGLLALILIFLIIFVIASSTMPYYYLTNLFAFML